MSLSHCDTTTLKYLSKNGTSSGHHPTPCDTLFQLVFPGQNMPTDLLGPFRLAQMFSP